MWPGAAKTISWLEAELDRDEAVRLGVVNWLELTHERLRGLLCGAARWKYAHYTVAVQAVDV